MSDTCGHTVTNTAGIEEPCGRPLSDWRWYEGHLHEDCLEPVCERHGNEAGRRMHEAEETIRDLKQQLYVKTRHAEIAEQAQADHLVMIKRLQVDLERVQTELGRSREAQRVAEANAAKWGRAAERVGRTFLDARKLAEKIAGLDYRGPRPEEQVIAEKIIAVLDGGDGDE